MRMLSVHAGENAPRSRPKSPSTRTLLGLQREEHLHGGVWRIVLLPCLHVTLCERHAIDPASYGCWTLCSRPRDRRQQRKMNVKKSAKNKHRSVRSGLPKRTETAPADMRQFGEGLTRAVVARQLGKSVGAVRFYEGKALHPQRDVDGIWRFDPTEVEALASKVRETERMKTPAAELTPGKLAAQACRLFRDGKSVVDVVIALEQPFDVVQPLYRAFIEDSGAMQLPAALVERMAIICEVDKLTPEILLQTLEEDNRGLSALSVARHGGGFERADSEDPQK